MSFRSICLALICSFLVAGPGQARASSDVILVLGDSLSAGYGLRPEQGWVDLLRERLRSEGYGHRVVNASASGETTGGALARLPRALEKHRPSIVVIELGGNDGLRGLPTAGIRGNIEAMVEASRTAGARVLLVGMRIPPNYGPVYTEEFHALFGQVARERDLPMVPFFLDGIALDDSLMQADGFHPNAAAQPLMLEAVWKELEPMLPTR